MRNLAEHPVTAEEIVQCLTELAAEIAAENVNHNEAGDVRPLLLLEAVAIVESAEARRTADKTFRALEQALEYLRKQTKRRRSGDLP